MATLQRTGELVKAALQVIAESPEGHLPVKEVLSRVEKQIALTDHEKTLNKSGVLRWQTNLRFYSVDAVAAGWLIKKDRIWYITEEGRKSLALAPLAFIRTANQKYAESRGGPSSAAAKSEAEGDAEATGDEAPAVQHALLEQSEEAAYEEIKEYINAMEAYPFQSFVAALLRGMGYYTPFVAPPGKDGGIDIVAYRDPIGSTPPRIKVQVKHREQKVTVNEVRELIGLLAKEGDVGLIVSSSGMTGDALKEIRHSNHHIEALGMEEIIGLWGKHYDGMNENDRQYLRLKRVSFLDVQNPENIAS
ncbi:MAG TPA: Mrr restriction system protein [Terracidiphilus sp.]|nr:Mrr restriction system protein [Terracidiphilus sp.]